MPPLDPLQAGIELVQTVETVIRGHDVEEIPVDSGTTETESLGNDTGYANVNAPALVLPMDHNPATIPPFAASSLASAPPSASLPTASSSSLPPLSDRSGLGDDPGPETKRRRTTPQATPQTMSSRQKSATQIDKAMYRSPAADTNRPKTAPARAWWARFRAKSQWENIR